MYLVPKFYGTRVKVLDDEVSVPGTQIYGTIFKVLDVGVVDDNSRS